VLVAGLKMVRKFLATPQLSHFVEREEVPGTAGRHGR
jgi:hypothetical protein